MRAYMKEEFAALKAQAESQPAVTQPKPAQPAVLTLHEQLKRFFQEMPPLHRQRPWSIYELVNQLVGRYRSHPHPQHVACELRALGWTSTRIWVREGYGKRVWRPPRPPSTSKSFQS